MNLPGIGCGYKVGQTWAMFTTCIVFLQDGIQSYCSRSSTFTRECTDSIRRMNLGTIITSTYTQIPMINVSNFPDAVSTGR